MKNYQFKIIIEKDEDGYFVASAPSLPGCHTQGKTYEKTMERMREAILLCLEVQATDEKYKKKTSYHSYKPKFFGIEDLAVQV
jgi:predicted RNase H-like HicB family nuclease